MRIKLWICATLALLPLAVSAQSPFSDGSEFTAPPVWKSFNLNPKTRVKLGFQNSSVDMILAFFQKNSGITIIKDPALTGSLTLTSAKPVSLGEAFQILDTTLKLKNYELQKDGKLLVVRQRNQRPNNGGGGGSPTMSPEDLERVLSSGRLSLKVYPITYANASQVARVINEVFASTQNPTDALMQFMQGGTFGGNRGGGGGGGGNNRGNNGRGGFNPFQGGNRGGGGAFRGFGGGMGQQQNVRASSDDFSNSVIVNAPSNIQDQVEDLIHRLDKKTDDPQHSRVFKLEFASATDLAPVVQNVLVSNAPKGRGGISGQNVPIEQRFQQAVRLGGAQAAFGTVVADERTNSLVVTATDENLLVVEQLLKDLDTEVKFENTTFVFSLNNARADQIATLLQQAFGTRQGTGGNFNGNRNNQNQNRNNQNQNRNNQNRNNGGGGLRGGQTNAVDPDGRNLELALEDPDADSGDLQTNISVAQGGGFGQFLGGQQRRPQGQGSTTGRDENGRLVNVRDLTGQVTVIPDPNTNSLIVVTTPENAELIKGILDQLDKIPEQVMIETMIVEATLDSTSKFGVEWKFAQTRPFGTPGTTGTGEGAFGLQNASPALQGFRYTLAGGALTAFMNALQTDQKFQVLSTPRIFTSNNQQAQINISQSIPYVLSTREDANGNLTFNYSFQDVGIVLTVTPHISTDGYVTMDVNQTANDLQGFTDFNAPIVNQRQAETVVSVRDGETIILGGIIRDNITSTTKKIPLLGDIPLLGQIFRSTDKQKVKTELLVFLTPRVVRDPAEARRLREEDTKGLSKPTQDIIKNQIKKPDTSGSSSSKEKGKGGN